LQDTEIKLTGITKTLDVLMKSGTSVIVFVDAFVV